MDRTVALTWSFLNVLTKKRADALRAHFGSLEEALKGLNEEILRELGCREDTAMKVLNRLEAFDTGGYERELKKRDLQLISIEDSAYPRALSTIDDPPIFLYYRGDLSILDQPCLALVGTREMSDYGKRITEAIVPGIVAAHVVTVSGLAYGVDALVAKETIRAGGRTVAVLGHGLGAIYPKGHAALADQIVSSGGLLLSEFPLDQPPDKYTFPARNRIIAGLSLGTVVLEASRGSGSLITADLALDYNREVFTVPGQIFDPHYGGCHELISKGTAKLVTSAEEILAELGIASSLPAAGSTCPPLREGMLDSPQEEAIYSALTRMPQTVDDIVVKTALDAAVLHATLTVLELKGTAKKVGQGSWVRT